MMDRVKNFLSLFLLIFLKNTTLLHRFLDIWEAFIHPIQISEVEDMRSQVFAGNWSKF